MTTTTHRLREVKGYCLQKVKRNLEGSYAIVKDGKKSECQFNSGTVKHLIKMSDEEFYNFAKSRITNS